MQNDKEKFKNDFYRRLIEFSISVINFCAIIRKDRSLWVIADRLVDSATSIGANVNEGKSSHSKKDYTKFFEIALKSANESIFRLKVIMGYSEKYRTEGEKLLKEVQEIGNILGSSVITLKGRR